MCCFMVWAWLSEEEEKIVDSWVSRFCAPNTDWLWLSQGKLRGYLYYHSKGSSHIWKERTLSTRGGGVNPCSLIEPKFTRFSNHSERDFWHHNMNANASRLAWYGFPISSLPPNPSLRPLSNYCLKTPSHISWTSGQTVPPLSSNKILISICWFLFFF